MTCTRSAPRTSPATGPVRGWHGVLGGRCTNRCYPRKAVKQPTRTLPLVSPQQTRPLVFTSPAVHRHRSSPSSRCPPLNTFPPRNHPPDQGMFPAATPQNSGQPGCTPAEKGRHSLLLESGGGLVDAYRHLHPAGAAGAKTGTDTEGMTWRGTAGNQVAASGRYYGKVRQET